MKANKIKQEVRLAAYLYNLDLNDMSEYIKAVVYSKNPQLNNLN